LEGLDRRIWLSQIKLGFERFANFEMNVFIPQTNKKGASVWTDAPFCFSTSSYD